MSKEIIRTELGAKLRKLRKERGLTLEQVGEALGIKPNTYGKYEREIAPKQETLIKIAEFFDVSIDYLVGKEEKAPKKSGSVYTETEGSTEGLTARNHNSYQVVDDDLGRLSEMEILIIKKYRAVSDKDKSEIAKYIKKKKDEKKQAVI